MWIQIRGLGMDLNQQPLQLNLLLLILSANFNQTWYMGSTVLG